VSPDGKIIAFNEGTHGNHDIWTIPFEGEHKPQIFLQTKFSESHPVFSPDGRWIAFHSNSPGQSQIFVKQYPNGIIRQITSKGVNRFPVWSAEGDELFFVESSGDPQIRMMAVSIETSPHLSWSDPKILFEGAYRELTNDRNFDIHPNGQRFLLIKEIDRAVENQQINIVLNWFEELKSLVPTKK
jgi:dipeptidyl aminopeptidase/acylaminoacyl peptidase